MEIPKKPFLGNDLLEDEEIDTLFKRLEQLKPPDSFVQQMLESFSHLPLPQKLQEESKKLGDDGEGLIVHHEPKRPS